jgi:WD40 repeat protein
LGIYANIISPENVARILWLSNGDKLGLLADNRIHTYAVPSFLSDGTLALPRRQSIYNIAYMKDLGDVLLINQSGKLLLWSLSKNESLRSYSWDNMDLTSAQISPSTNVIARSGVQVENRQRIIEIIDLSGNVVQKLVGHKNDIPILDFSPDEKILVASAAGRASSQNLIFVWDIFSGKLLYSLPNPTNGGAIVKFNHVGDQLAVADDNCLRLWDVDGRKWLDNQWEYEIGEGYINDLIFTSSDDLIIANTSNNEVLFINAQDGSLLELPVLPEKILDGVLSPNGRYLASSDGTGRISIWGAMDN